MMSSILLDHLLWSTPMARPTIAQLSVEFEHLRVHCTEQDTRIRCDAETIRLLKYQIDHMAITEQPADSALPAAPSMSMGDLSIRYCREKNICICTVDDLRAYARHHGITLARSF